MFGRRVALSLIFIFLLFIFVYPFKKIELIIPSKVNTEEIAEILKNKKIIYSKSFFVSLTKLLKVDRDLKQGFFKFKINPFFKIPNDFKVIYFLYNDKSIKIKITIPEGLSSKQIAKILKEKIFIDEANFLKIVNKKKLEGYLFPATYFFSPYTSEEYIVKIMTEEFHKRINTPQIQKRIEQLNTTLHRIIILASIIEKEAKTSQERKIISGVFWNRLKKRWRLESCATVIYALGEHKQKLTYKDLKVKSTYNTYLYYGLPPGPICNPGEESILAAIYPQQTDLLFFISDGKGTHHFFTSYKEHLNKKNLKKKRKMYN